MRERKKGRNESELKRGKKKEKEKKKIHVRLKGSAALGGPVIYCAVAAAGPRRHA